MSELKRQLDELFVYWPLLVWGIATITFCVAVVLVVYWYRRRSS